MGKTGFGHWILAFGIYLGFGIFELPLTLLWPDRQAERG
jgi:hypothetical protein